MTAYGNQTDSSQAMLVDLVGADGTTAASSIVAGPLWAASQAQLNADAESHGLTLNSWVAGPSDAADKQSLTTYAQAHAWIVQTSQYARSVGPVLASTPAAALTGPAIVGGLLLAGVGALAVWVLLK